MFVFELLFELILTVVVEVIIIGPGYLVMRCARKQPNDTTAGLIGVAIWVTFGLAIWAAIKLT